MDKTVAGVLGAVGALIAGTAAQAATPESVLHAASYAELLQPIANASATLRALDAQEAARADGAALEQVQYYYPPPYYYHHHHHHRYYRPRYYYHHHHHHHHHHHGYGGGYYYGR